jgi:hypothetical protein
LYETFELASDLSIVDCARRLGQSIAASSTPDAECGDKHFRGIVRGDGFEIEKVVQDDDCFFRPYLTGKFVAVPDGTEISVTMTLSPRMQKTLRFLYAVTALIAIGPAIVGGGLVGVPMAILGLFLFGSKSVGDFEDEAKDVPSQLCGILQATVRT